MRRKMVRELSYLDVMGSREYGATRTKTISEHRACEAVKGRCSQGGSIRLCVINGAQSVKAESLRRNPRLRELRAKQLLRSQRDGVLKDRGGALSAGNGRVSTRKQTPINVIANIESI